MTALEVGIFDPPLRRREGRREHAPIASVTRQAAGDFRFLPLHPHLDRALAQHRHQHLCLQRADTRIGPGIGTEPGDIGKARHVAPRRIAMHAGMRRIAVAEAAMLLVAGGTRHRAVDRQIGIVEEPPAKLGLGGGGGVGRRHARLGQPGRQRGRKARSRRHPCHQPEHTREQPGTNRPAHGNKVTSTGSLGVPLPEISSR
jgi:hypothetical protein